MIGAGEMSKLAVGQFTNKGFRKLYLMNRTREHAEKLAATAHAEVVSFCDIKEILGQVDLCICCSSAPHYILEKDSVAKVMPQRTQQKLVILDISMPRNVDPKVREVEGVTLFDIDDLDSVVAKNMEKRQTAVSEVLFIVEDKVQSFQEKARKIQYHNPSISVESAQEHSA